MIFHILWPVIPLYLNTYITEEKNDDEEPKKNDNETKDTNDKGTSEEKDKKTPGEKELLDQKQSRFAKEVIAKEISEKKRQNKNMKNFKEQFEKYCSLNE